jgi:hypothetical protein
MNSFSLIGPESLNGNTYKIIKITNNPIENGKKLLKEYEEISEDNYNQNNRFTLFLPPGVYDLGNKSLNLYKPSVNIIGLGEGAAQQKIISSVPTGAVFNILHDGLNIKNLTINNTFEILNPTDQQVAELSAYNMANTNKTYGLFAPTALYYLYKFTIRDGVNYITFKNMNSNFYKEIYNHLNPFPSTWNLNFFNTPIYKAEDQDLYVAKFQNTANNLPLAWYIFSKSTTSNLINIIKFSTESYKPFPWQCNVWKNFSNPQETAEVDFKIWPWPEDYNNLENIALEEMFWALTMPTNSCFIGNFKNVKAGRCSFGGYDGFAAGKFENCEGEMYSFGHPWDFDRTNQDKLLFCSGEFINCKSNLGSFGHLGLIAGKFNNCHQIAGNLENQMDIGYATFGDLTGITSSMSNCFIYGTGQNMTVDDPTPVGSLWNESTDGDLSNNPYSPTSIGALSGPVNSIYIIRNESSAFDSDFFTLNIPPNKQIVEIKLTKFETDNSTIPLFFGIQAGSAWTAGGDETLMIGSAYLRPNNLNQNILTAMNLTSVGQGNITFRNQYLSTAIAALEFQIKII